MAAKVRRHWFNPEEVRHASRNADSACPFLYWRNGKKGHAESAFRDACRTSSGFNPCRLGSRGHLGANFSLLLYTDLIKKRKPSRAAKKPNLNLPPYFHRASYAPVWKAIHSNSPRVIGNIVFSKNKNAVAMEDSNLKKISEHSRSRTQDLHYSLEAQQFQIQVSCLYMYRLV